MRRQNVAAGAFALPIASQKTCITREERSCICSGERFHVAQGGETARAADFQREIGGFFVLLITPGAIDPVIS